MTRYYYDDTTGAMAFGNDEFGTLIFSHGTVEIIES